MARSDFTRYKYPHYLAQNGDDWLIRYKGGRPIARASLDQRTTPHRWMWVTWTQPGTSGTTETLEAALQAIKAAILALPPEQRIKPMTPGDMARRDNPGLRRYGKLAR